VVVISGMFDDGRHIRSESTKVAREEDRFHGRARRRADSMHEQHPDFFCVFCRLLHVVVVISGMGDDGRHIRSESTKVAREEDRFHGSAR